MFPELGQKGSATGQPTGQFPPQQFQGPIQDRQPSPQELARMQELHERIKGKIQSMSRYNNLMGSSDKDFITRILLSQLASADPYSSDFYAQVFSALRRRQEEEEGPTVVKINKGFGFGVGGPAGNRFGKMGTSTMQKLSSQVKKLVENRQTRSMGSGESKRVLKCRDYSLTCQPPCKVLLARSPGGTLSLLDQSSPFLLRRSQRPDPSLLSTSNPASGVIL